MKVGFVTTYSSKHPAGLERCTLDLLISVLNKDKQNQYLIYTKQGSGLAGSLAGIDHPNFKVIEVGFGSLWKEIGLFFASKSDIYIFNGQVAPILFFPKNSLVLVYDFAHKYFKVDSFSKKLKNYFMDFSIKLGGMRAKRIISISQATKDEMVKFYNTKAEKIDVMYLGISGMYDLDQQKISNAVDNFFFFIGTIKERKNVFNIVKAFILFRKENPEYQHKLFLSGKYNQQSPYIKKMLAYIKEADRQNDVIFLGHVTDQEVSFLYHNARALVFPSLLEGFGFPILESMSCGTPVITSNISSLKEVAGNAAIQVDPHNVKEIAQAIQNLVEDDDLHQRLIEAGLKRAEEFSWDKTAQRFIEIISKLNI